MYIKTNVFLFKLKYAYVNAIIFMFYCNEHFSSDIYKVLLVVCVACVIYIFTWLAVCVHVHVCCLLVHAGFLCGSCRAGTAVSLDLQSCSDQCAVGIIVFIVMCKCSMLEQMNALATIIHPVYQCLQRAPQLYHFL